MDLFELVALTVDIPEHGLRTGQTGTIVCIFDPPDPGYQVEFTDSAGNPFVQVRVLAHEIRPVGPGGAQRFWPFFI